MRTDLGARLEYQDRCRKFVHLTLMPHTPREVTSWVSILWALMTRANIRLPADHGSRPHLDRLDSGVFEIIPARKFCSVSVSDGVVADSLAIDIPDLA